MSWCQTNKRLPAKDGMYLVNVLTEGLKDNIMLVAVFDGGKWKVPDEWKESVSHWRHLPSPPKLESLMVK